MKQTGYFSCAVVLCVALVAVLLYRINSLESQVRSLGVPAGAGLAKLQDSLKNVQNEVKAAKDLAPGLGEYMTTIQLHASKLWFAVKASNWPLAEYELDELRETMEAAKGLNAEKNGVKISNILDSVLQTQVAQLAESIKRQSAGEFQKFYDETLAACNGCHTESGHKFIQITRPSAPPVANQKWEMSAQLPNTKP
jgi:outer membrane murein-binding lipoprotein Lpp